MSGPGHIPQEMERLLGGYATGTLSEAEHNALMRAALENQALFDALVDEEALRETLADPAARRALLEALGAGKVHSSLARRWWWVATPATLAVALGVWLAGLPARKPAEIAMTARKEAPAPTPQVQAPTAQVPPEPVTTPKAKARAEALAEPAVARDKEAAPAAAGKLEREAAAAAEPDRGLEQNKAVFGAPPVPAPAEARKAAADAIVVAPVEMRAVEGGRRDAPAAAAARAAFVAPEQRIDALLAYQDEDGTWRTARPAEGAPAGRPLRLTVTAGQGGTLVLDPPLAAGRAVEAGKPVEILIPPQKAGELALDLTVGPEGMARGGARPLRLRVTPAREFPAPGRLSLRIKIIE